jgi:hypothetical protein
MSLSLPSSVSFGGAGLTLGDHLITCHSGNDQ